VTAPKPDIVENLVTDVCSLAKVVNLDYGWLYASAYSRGRVGEAASRQRHGDHADLSDLFLDRDGESGESAINYVRREIEGMAADIAAAKGALQRADSRRRNIEDRIDAGKPIEPERHESVIERPADAGDIARAKDAKVRRDARAAKRALPWSGEEIGK
jgi:hypothetical protein